MKWSECKELIRQDSLPLPDYTAKEGKLFSKRAAKIEQLLNKRKQMFGLECDIMVSKSCLEEKMIWDEVMNNI